jgi:CBS domain-containing protein
MPRLVREIMVRDVSTVRPETSLPDLERAFQRERVSGFPVVGQDGQLVGIVSRTDVLRQLAAERSLGESLVDTCRDDSDEDWADESSSAIGRIVGERMERQCVRDIMRTELVSAAPGDSVRHVAGLMLDHRVHRVPVVDEGRLVGLLSSMDLVRLVAEE